MTDTLAVIHYLRGLQYPAAIFSKGPYRKNVTISGITNHAVLVKNSHDLLYKEIYKLTQRNAAVTVDNASLRFFHKMISWHRTNSIINFQSLWIHSCDIGKFKVMNLPNQAAFFSNLTERVKVHSYLLRKISIVHLRID